MATTTNYAWETPDDTDLVKDGAAAIRTLGSSIDTTTKALNPSTTLGDIEYRSATANTNTRLGIGTSGQVLAVNGSGVPAWTTVSSGGMTLLSTTTLNGATDFQVTSISGSYQDLYILIIGAKTGTESNKYRIFINSTGGTNTNSMSKYGLTGEANNIGEAVQLDSDTIVTKSTTLTNSYAINIFGYANTDGFKPISFNSVWNDSTTKLVGMGSASYTATTAISSVQFSNWAGVNFTGGTMYIYGVK
jgi:hypothetical protein